jgi:hypothetical protein
MFKKAVYITVIFTLILAGFAIASEQTVVMEIKGMSCGL